MIIDDNRKECQVVVAAEGGVFESGKMVKVGERALPRNGVGTYRACAKINIIRSIRSIHAEVVALGWESGLVYHYNLFRIHS
jgi:hypothetical protein